MSSVPTDTKTAVVSMTFTVTKMLGDAPKLSELEAIRKTAAEAKTALGNLGAVVTGHVIIGKQKFEL